MAAVLASVAWTAPVCRALTSVADGDEELTGRIDEAMAKVRPDLGWRSCSGTAAANPVALSSYRPTRSGSGWQFSLTPFFWAPAMHGSLTVDGQEVDFNALITKSAEGLDEEAQKPTVTELAINFNKILPIVPLWERYGNNASLEGTRVANFPPDDDPIWKNPLYADNPVVILLLQGKLKPV